MILFTAVWLEALVVAAIFAGVAALLVIATWPYP